MSQFPNTGLPKGPLLWGSLFLIINTPASGGESLRPGASKMGTIQRNRSVTSSS